MTEVLKNEADAVFTDRFNDEITKKCKANIKESAGMPINIQVVSMKWKDEQCLAVMKLLEESLNFKKEPKLDHLSLDKSDSLKPI